MAPESQVRGLTRTMLRVSIVCLCVTAAIAIGALVGGEYGETEGKITLTTLAIAVYNVTGLAGVALVRDRSAAWLGVVCALVSAVAFALALGVIWSDPFDGGDDEGLAKAWGAASVIAVSLAQVSLLLLRRRAGDSPTVRTVLTATIAAIALLAILVINPILAEDDPEESYWRFVGAVGVLDALGMLVLPILRRLQAPAPAAVAATAPLRADADALTERLGLVQDALARGDAFLLPAGGLVAYLGAAHRAGGHILIDRTESQGGGAFAVVLAEDGAPVALVEAPPRG